MPRILSTLLLLLALGVHLPGAAHATQTVAYFVQQLKTSDDYRVRTQAALALGASGEDAAVQPLCDALGDSNVSVKVAAAAGLGKLGKPAALPCLKAAQTKETAPAVKTQLDKSIASLGQAGGGGSIAPSVSPPPPPGPDTKFYIAIQVANKTMRSARSSPRSNAKEDQGRESAGRGTCRPKSTAVLDGGGRCSPKDHAGYVNANGDMYMERKVRLLAAVGYSAPALIGPGENDGPHMVLGGFSTHVDHSHRSQSQEHHRRPARGGRR